MEHVNNIKRGHMDTMLYAHFNNYGIQNLKYIGLDHNTLWSKNQRLRHESQLIKKLGTISPQGLNERA